MSEDVGVTELICLKEFQPHCLTIFTCSYFLPTKRILIWMVEWSKGGMAQFNFFFEFQLEKGLFINYITI